MSKEDLIDISTRPNHKELSIKGGSVKSDAKKSAAKLRGLKLTKPENLENKYLALVRDPEISAIQIVEVIGEMLEHEDLNTKTRIDLIGKMVQAHTAIHGAKMKNLNVNIDLTSNRVIERLKNWKEKEQIEIIEGGKK